jgi:hypothetical protein
MKIYLAAAESHYQTYDLVYPKYANIFCSYYYKNNTEWALTQFKKVGHKGTIVIDSGAHTFFGHKGIVAVQLYDKSKKKMPDPMEYFKAYLVWVKKWYKFFDYFVELDLQELLSYDIILKWRDMFKEAGVFDKCITCYHTGDNWLQFTEMINQSESKYIGLEGHRLGWEHLPYNKFLKYCYENNCKAHGFAFTRMALLKEFPFYSVDSSSWLRTVKFGSINVFDKETKTVRLVAPTKANFLRFKFPINFHNTCKGKEIYKIKDEYSMDAFLEYEKYITDYWKVRGILWKN